MPTILPLSSLANEIGTCRVIGDPSFSQPSIWIETPRIPVCALDAPERALRWFMSVAAGRQKWHSDTRRTAL